jgi:hypothetical protein
MSGRVGATFIKRSLLASNIPVRRPWLQCQANKLAKRTRNMTNRGGGGGEGEREREEIEITLKIVQELQGLNPCIPLELQSVEALK